ncbi:MAG: hypothetical protein JWQ72_346, partial [Polaromonas sp.]|nr:hypothetical protein [Polaromonas sp.]
MRPLLVVVAPPCLEALSGIGQDRNQEAFRHLARSRALNA